jgi:hypothetical protein
MAERSFQRELPSAAHAAVPASRIRGTSPYVELFDLTYELSLIDSPEKLRVGHELDEFELSGEMTWLVRSN